MTTILNFINNKFDVREKKPEKNSFIKTEFIVSLITFDKKKKIRLKPTSFSQCSEGHHLGKC